MAVENDAVGAAFTRGLFELRNGPGLSSISEEVRPLLDEARDSYASMKNPNSFELVQAAECSVLLSESAEALALLLNVENSKREAHWHHRCAQALRVGGKLDEALGEIEQSIKDASAAKFVAAFLEERWRIKQANGDADALDSLRQAVAESVADSKFGIALRERLAKEEAARNDP